MRLADDTSPLKTIKERNHFPPGIYGIQNMLSSQCDWNSFYSGSMHSFTYLLHFPTPLLHHNVNIIELMNACECWSTRYFEPNCNSIFWTSTQFFSSFIRNQLNLYQKSRKIIKSLHQISIEFLSEVEQKWLQEVKRRKFLLP